MHISFKIFLLILCEFYINLYYIHLNDNTIIIILYSPQLLSLTPPRSTSSKFVSFFKKTKSIEFNLRSLITLGSPLEHGQPSRGHILQEN